MRPTANHSCAINEACPSQSHISPVWQEKWQSPELFESGSLPHTRDPICSGLPSCSTCGHVLNSLCSVTRTKSWTWWHTVKWGRHVRNDDCHPVISVALKKAIYFAQPLRMCHNFRACQNQREREGQRDFLRTCTQVYIFVCVTELALILLVVIGVSARPHTLGCGCNCPRQAGPVTTWRRGEGRGGEQGPLFVAAATCLPVWHCRAPGCEVPGFGEMIVIAPALKMPV